MADYVQRFKDYQAAERSTRSRDDSRQSNRNPGRGGRGGRGGRNHPPPHRGRQSERPYDRYSDRQSDRRRDTRDSDRRYQTESSTSSSSSSYNGRDDRPYYDDLDSREGKESRKETKPKYTRFQRIAMDMLIVQHSIEEHKGLLSDVKLGPGLGSIINTAVQSFKIPLTSPQLEKEFRDIKINTFSATVEAVQKDAIRLLELDVQQLGSQAEGLDAMTYPDFDTEFNVAADSVQRGKTRLSQSTIKKVERCLEANMHLLIPDTESEAASARSSPPPRPPPVEKRKRDLTDVSPVAAKRPPKPDDVRVTRPPAAVPRTSPPAPSFSKIYSTTDTIQGCAELPLLPDRIYTDPTHFLASPPVFETIRPSKACSVLLQQGMLYKLDHESRLYPGELRGSLSNSGIRTITSRRDPLSPKFSHPVKYFGLEWASVWHAYYGIRLMVEANMPLDKAHTAMASHTTPDRIVDYVIRQIKKSPNPQPKLWNDTTRNHHMYQIIWSNAFYNMFFVRTLLAPGIKSYKLSQTNDGKVQPPPYWSGDHNKYGKLLGTCRQELLQVATYLYQYQFVQPFAVRGTRHIYLGTEMPLGNLPEHTHDRFVNRAIDDLHDDTHSLQESAPPAETEEEGVSEAASENMGDSEDHTDDDNSSRATTAETAERSPPKGTPPGVERFAEMKRAKRNITSDPGFLPLETTGRQDDMTTTETADRREDPAHLQLQSAKTEPQSQESSDVPPATQGQRESFDTQLSFESAFNLVDTELIDREAKAYYAAKEAAAPDAQVPPRTPSLRIQRIDQVTPRSRLSLSARKQQQQSGSPQVADRDIPTPTGRQERRSTSGSLSKPIPHKTTTSRYLIADTVSTTTNPEIYPQLKHPQFTPCFNVDDANTKICIIGDDHLLAVAQPFILDQPTLAVGIPELTCAQLVETVLPGLKGPYNNVQKVALLAGTKDMELEKTPTRLIGSSLPNALMEQFPHATFYYYLMVPHGKTPGVTRKSVQNVHKYIRKAASQHQPESTAVVVHPEWTDDDFSPVAPYILKQETGGQKLRDSLIQELSGNE